MSFYPTKPDCPRGWTSLIQGRAWWKLFSHLAVAVGSTALLAGEPSPGKVWVEICEEGVPKDGTWPTQASVTESYPENAFGLFELPHKYISTGVRGDRAFPTLVRASAEVQVPAGKHRILPDHASRGGHLPRARGSLRKSAAWRGRTGCDVATAVLDVSAETVPEKVGMVTQLDHPERPALRVLANPIRVDGRRLPAEAAPALGADTKRVLAGLGYSSDDIAKMEQSRVI